jgi:4'-phosphopantetheinyl transferase
MLADLTIAAGGPSGGARAPWLLAGATGHVLAEFGDAWSLLSAVERDRAAAFRFTADRDDFIAAHLLARSCAAGLLDLAPTAVAIAQRCEVCGGEHGRPYVVEQPGAYVSWSHARGYVAAGAATVPIGVDVEVLGHVRLDDYLLDTVLTGADVAAVKAAAHPERVFSLQWARKECLIKLGLADLDTVRHVELTGLPVEPDHLPGRWQSWRDGMHVLSWWDGTRHAVGAAVKLVPQRSGLR